MPPRAAAQPFLNSTTLALADHHTDLLVLGWRRRKAYLADAALDFSDLFTLDDRLQAALESLLLLGEQARAHMRALLHDEVRGGEMFVLTLYALAARDTAMLEACRALAIAIPALETPWIDALEWAPVSPLLQACIEKLPVATYLHVAGMRYRDFLGMAELTLSRMKTFEPGAAEICAAFRMVRHFGRRDLALAGQRYLHVEEADVRLNAAWTMLALAPAEHSDAALSSLIELADSDHTAIGDQALKCIFLHAPDRVTDTLEIARRAGSTRLHLLALGWTGKVDAVPALAKHLDDVRYSRVAGASLSLITGSDPSRDGWLGAKPSHSAKGNAVDEQIPDGDVDNALPWPDPAAFANWWSTHCYRFEGHQRYFAGSPLTTQWLATVLMSGPLAWRPLAAEHLQRLTHCPLFPTGLPATTQSELFHEIILGDIR